MIREKVAKFYIALVVFIFSRVRGLRVKAILALKKIREYLEDEAYDTQEMVDIYRKYIQGTASKEEIREANIQFQDLVKNLGLGLLIILPFSPITLPIIIKLSRRLGIDIFPTPSKKPKN